MKSRAPLILMEQMVMLLVFALAASLSLQAFVRSDEISLRSYQKSKASLAAQNTVETIRHSGGSLDHALTKTAEVLGGDYSEADSSLSIVYDEEWNITEGNGSYFLTVEEIPASAKDLHKVKVQVFDGLDKQEVLFELQTAWLEVKTDE